MTSAIKLFASVVPGISVHAACANSTALLPAGAVRLPRVSCSRAAAMAACISGLNTAAAAAVAGAFGSTAAGADGATIGATTEASALRGAGIGSAAMAEVGIGVGAVTNGEVSPTFACAGKRPRNTNNPSTISTAPNAVQIHGSRHGFFAMMVSNSRSSRLTVCVPVRRSMRSSACNICCALRNRLSGDFSIALSMKACQ